MFCLIFLIFVFDQCVIRTHQIDDEQPFITDDNKVIDKFMLIPSIGYELNDKPGKFNLIINGWYYEPLNSKILQTLIKSSLRLTLNVFDRNNELSMIKNEDRLGPFFVHDVPDHHIQLKLSNSITETVITDENGRFNKEILVDSFDDLNIKNHILKYIAYDNDNLQEITEGRIFLMKISQPYGCSIISDIDDTIKISEVPDKKKLMINTFKNDFRAVPGMSDVYQLWESLHHCLIHYVSAMPSQLYYVTQKFLDRENFPRGSFHMRHLKLVREEKRELIKHLKEFSKPESSKKHKLIVIKDILEHAPLTQEFIMVGDSGELDPEIYGNIARDYPERIKMIFIRLVNGGNNDQDRFEIAFQNISKKKWKLFSNANELPRKLFSDIIKLPRNLYEVSINHGISLSISLFFIFLVLIYV